MDRYTDAAGHTREPGTARLRTDSCSMVDCWDYIHRPSVDAAAAAGAVVLHTGCDTQSLDWGFAMEQHHLGR